MCFLLCLHHTEGFQCIPGNTVSTAGTAGGTSLLGQSCWPSLLGGMPTVVCVCVWVVNVANLSYPLFGREDIGKKPFEIRFLVEPEVDASLCRTSRGQVL